MSGQVSQCFSQNLNLLFIIWDNECMVDLFWKTFFYFNSSLLFFVILHKIAKSRVDEKLNDRHLVEFKSTPEYNRKRSYKIKVPEVDIADDNPEDLRDKHIKQDIFIFLKVFAINIPLTHWICNFYKLISKL